MTASEHNTAAWKASRLQVAAVGILGTRPLRRRAPRVLTMQPEISDRPVLCPQAVNRGSEKTSYSQHEPDECGDNRSWGGAPESPTPQRGKQQCNTLGVTAGRAPAPGSLVRSEEVAGRIAFLGLAAGHASATQPYTRVGPEHGLFLGVSGQLLACDHPKLGRFPRFGAGPADFLR